MSPELGNFDYLMACDIDTDAVEGELRDWGRWLVDTTGVNGFRIDAAKHVRASVFRDWLNHLRGHFGDRELFAVGEYWSPRIEDLRRYIAQTEGAMSLFDVPLHYRLREASVSGSRYDLRTIFDSTLVQEQPARAVTFVDNHDTQPYQALESWVEPWFKPHAHALILLRKDGYPCVFLADYLGHRYEEHGNEVTLWSHQGLIDRFLQARHAYGYGEQEDYFDHPNTIGWLRLGDGEHPGAMAVVLSNGDAGSKWMNTFRPGATFRDATGHDPDDVVANGEGWAEFRCPAGNVSVWLQA